MKAMILAAGRGERMKPLTDSCPKPLLKIAGMPLIEHLIRQLAQAGINQLVINHAWLGAQIETFCGDGAKWQSSIVYSAETTALETAGGIVKALPLLGNEPFLVVNGDIYTDFDFANLPVLDGRMLAHLWLVDNPAHNLTGDFVLANGRLHNLCAPHLSGDSSATDCRANSNYQQTLTFSGIGLYRPEFFQSIAGTTQAAPLAPLLRQTVEQQQVSASKLNAQWVDVGTPARLAELNLLTQSQHKLLDNS